MWGRIRPGSDLEAADADRASRLELLRFQIAELDALALADGEAPRDPLQDYEELDSTTVLDAPAAEPGRFAPENLHQVERGQYLVELLGCGACHTDGALEGVPDFDKALAGSSIGIAHSSPLVSYFHPT